MPGDAPFHGRFRVEALSDGRFPFTGEMYAGGVAELGPTAALRVLDRDSDVRVVVGSRRCQCLDRAIFSHLGIAPHEQRVLAVKSTVHFRADFEPISETILLAEAPGLNPCRLESIPYRRPARRRSPRRRREAVRRPDPVAGRGSPADTAWFLAAVSGGVDAGGALIVSGHARQRIDRIPDATIEGDPR